MTKRGLYVHIPFCTSLCHYCDFVKVIYQKKWVASYLEKLKHDLSFFNVSRDLSTLYIGGGTPSSLSYYELRNLLELLKPYTANVKEYTVEANVESLTLPKLKLMRSYGVNRLSIGVQTTDDYMLKKLNRHHTYTMIKTKIALVKKALFTNFSVDLIYGLPGQTLSDLENDLMNIIKLGAPHISTYSLTIEKGTMAALKKWEVPSDDTLREMYDFILKTLRNNNYIRYEVSNFALKGYESIHNKLYWENRNYYGIGLGASGYIDGKRYLISGGLTKYLKGESIINYDEITSEEYVEEYLMLNLRLAQGFSLQDFKTRVGFDFLEKYGTKVKSLIERGLLNVTDDKVYATDEGIMLLDQVVLTLIM
ncbi:MAG: radical SAM family heme chaperone HemW [Bacilli bacterium]|jgi:oxygen-independent coproporphyrinogen-3 oxidase|nr:radical SAM family heme chaperone HemW [Erysipelotrichaceae bacterium]HOA11139.1 radical SAM family heme chaperone HemW [Bacilli bacterium]HOM32171.1 radical SAM family heme chaperone HemW [Bacilli bacterium]HQB96797.1 radical SAM family heme chaperone HemW [Bacilli bacterium]